MRDFGIRMEGCEDAIEAIVKEACERFDPFRYLEIGVGGGGTLKAVTDISKENHKGKWLTIGVDIPRGYSLKQEEVVARLPDIHIGDGVFYPYWESANLMLVGAESFLKIYDSAIHLVLIDGCHGKACVMADFLGVEPLVEKGGYVIFHDAGIDEQGVDMQPHCGTAIRVRDALIDMDLLWANTGKYREGWTFHSFIEGDKARGGHSCVVVQKA